MKKRQIPTLMVILLLVCSPLIGLMQNANATGEYVLASHWYTDGSNFVASTSHPSSSATLVSGCSESFNVSATVYITRVQVALKKGGTPTGTVYCQLNSNHTTGMPDVELAVSTTTVNVASLTTSWVNYTFYFVSSMYQLQANEWYAFSLTGVGVFDAANYVSVMAKSGGSTYVGEPGYYHFETDSADWSVVTAGSDLSFYVWGDTDLASSTTEPLPTGGINVDTSDSDAVFNALIGYMIPIVVMLLPAVFMWLIGGRGKWPLLIGIAIGSGIGYLFGLVPVWLVFLVSVALIGLAYTDVSSGNGRT